MNNSTLYKLINKLEEGEIIAKNLKYVDILDKKINGVFLKYYLIDSLYEKTGLFFLSMVYY
ncbi:hypothetical protein [Psychrilyobacter atlanticus]|uniref:hypothetical protein n=1 Tax=Psychrilyobacter atlanticus TaxID=271091 RepID=UPI000429D49B|nr:hypothetical protein [Psychrilyobacter atlanticus]